MDSLVLFLLPHVAEGPAESSARDDLDYSCCLGDQIILNPAGGRALIPLCATNV
jgi:hypothetical protein